MIEEIRPDFFRLEIPLPNSPLKFLNSYLIRSSDRNLIIDTGFDRKECYEAMCSGIKQLRIDMTRTDIFVTHLHVDRSSWSQFPPTQKWFATGEVIAHLHYLEEIGSIHRQVEGGIVRFAC